MNFNEIVFFKNSSFQFNSLLVLITPNYVHVIIACFCIYFSFTIYDNLLLVCSSLYNHSNYFSNSAPLVHVDPCL